MSALALFMVADWFFTPRYPTPERGYAGEWRPWDAFPVEERPLPPATTLWSNYQAWCAESDEIITRLYVARMGHADRQTAFKVSHDRTRNMPLGDYNFTWVEFNYSDPINGSYRLQWDLPGTHSPDFLRFDDGERLFLLQAFGSQDMPMLSVMAVEGTRPFYGSPRQSKGKGSPNQTVQRTEAGRSAHDTNRMSPATAGFRR